MLPMSLAPFIAFSALLLEHYDLSVFFVFENLGFDYGAFDVRRAEGRLAVLKKHKHLIQLDNVTRFRVLEAVNGEFIALLDSELSALGLDGGLHFGKANNKRDVGSSWQDVSSCVLRWMLSRTR
uniref:Uncharacterized protein n=1 Tax=uncultured marine microorganism HF4000_APKG3D20 TaxID=455549 RepID=B3T7C5_9ZZZZ|nr:hypothetical protein ALOHA_HF4000APKG3D20ctg1g32 [uncultured marine microorganism HF4000_APKG3D20]